MFIDAHIAVVGEWLVTVNKSRDIEVRLVHTPGQVVHTVRTGNGDDDGNITCITPVPGHSELLITGHEHGGVHLWDIGDKGARARECKNVNAGVHVRQIVRLEEKVNAIAALSTRIMCLRDHYRKVTIVHFDDEKSS
jgi:hypothetical protein